MKVQVTIEIDTADPRFRRLIDLVEQLAAEAHHPEPSAPARTAPDRGDAWEPPFDEFQEPPEPEGYRGSTPSRSASESPDEEESPPTDGRQLLGWAAKQVPDRKGSILSFGKKHGYPSKIVSWDRDQVVRAYRFARGSTTR